MRRRSSSRSRPTTCAGLSDPGRFTAHLSLGAGLDPTWLDLFSEAVRTVTGGGEPSDFLDARRELDGPDDLAGRTVERVDPRWVEAIARLADHEVPAVAGRWLDLLDEELGAAPARGEALDPRARRRGRHVLPGRRAGTRRPLRLVALSG